MQEDQKKEIQVSFGLKPSRQNKKSLRATQHLSFPKPRQTKQQPT
jgi:hypothetical protein